MCLKSWVDKMEMATHTNHWTPVIRMTEIIGPDG
jgi:hypothetical protein